MNPRAGVTDLLVFEARPFSHLGTPPDGCRGKAQAFLSPAPVIFSIIYFPALFKCGISELPGNYLGTYFR